jgi:hypothetical protein
MQWWVIALIVVVFLIIFLVVVVLSWIKARGVFIFTDCVVHNRAAIVEPWKEFRREGNSFFLFTWLIVLLFLAIVAVASLAFILPIILAGKDANLRNVSVIIGVGLFLCDRFFGSDCLVSHCALYGANHVSPPVSRGVGASGIRVTDYDVSCGDHSLFLISNSARHRLRNYWLCHDMPDVLYRRFTVCWDGDFASNFCFASLVPIVLSSPIRFGLRCLGGSATT